MHMRSEQLRPAAINGNGKSNGHHRKYTPPLPLNDGENRWDAQVRELSAKGFYAHTIARLTGLTLGQVQYRIPRIGTSPRMYRLGKNTEAKDALSDVEQLLAHTQFIHTTVKSLLQKRRRQRDTHRVMRRDVQPA